MQTARSDAKAAYSRRIQVLTVIILAGLISACRTTPNIRSFKVLPGFLCGPGPVTIQWDIAGSVRNTLSASPADFAEHDVAGAGTETSNISGPVTTITITAIGNESTVQKIEEVFVAPPGGYPYIIDAAIACNQETGELYWEPVTIPEADVQPGVTVVSVSNPSSTIPVTVTSSGGGTYTFDGAGTTSALNGPLAGTWTLGSALGGRRCVSNPNGGGYTVPDPPPGGINPPLPSNLTITLLLACSGS